MKVADYIFKFLSDRGVNSAYMVSGGQAMFLNDALCRNKNFHTICTHHEQAAGMSAESYSRITGKPSVALVTAGPGSINVLNGVVGAWTDSSPIFVISGQSGLSFVEYQEKTGIRQYGVQGIYIKPIVQSVTKYFKTIDDPCKIQYYMQKAYHLATTGRPGPVWLDVPLDIQKQEIPESNLEEFIPEDDFDIDIVMNNANKVTAMLKASKRPIILAGQGVRLSRAVEKFHELVNILKIPVLTSRLGIDLIESDHEYYIGRPGTYGERAANFAVQNADLIFAIGSRLATSLTGHNPKDFGRHAKKIMVDIDSKELDKPGVEIDLRVNCDAKIFIGELLKTYDPKENRNDYKNWIKKCIYWKKNYPVVLGEYKKEKPINSYHFTDRLSHFAAKDDVVLVDTGSCFHVACQVWKIKKGQRFLTTGGLSSMGYWVAGIGGCMANNRKRTIVITGDGSLQMNIQEFATIKHNNLPIKVFIFNNNGYLLIRHTQKNFMEGRLFGEGPETGVWCPDSMKIASAYEIKGVQIKDPSEVDEKIKEVMDYDGPVICDVINPEWQLIIPRISSEKLPDGRLVSKPYEDMFPFLDKDILKKEMIAEHESALSLDKEVLRKEIVAEDE